MSIVLDEYEWAERAIEARSLGNRPSETLRRVAKYYIENHYSPREARAQVETFLLQCDPLVQLSNWSDTLDRAVKGAGKYPLVRLSEVKVTDTEMACVQALKGTQLQRLAFTLLCVSKYWDLVLPDNNHWANSPDNEIMQMANVSTSIKRQSQMFATLRDAGMIRFAKKADNLNVQVLFSAPGCTVLSIHDFRNLGYQYLKYCGEPYFECVNCGLTVKAKEPGKGRHQKYCQSCAVEVKVKQSVDSAMRRKQVLKN